MRRNAREHGSKYKCDICGVETTAQESFITAHVIAHTYAEEMVEKAYSSDANKFPDSPTRTCNGLFLCRDCDFFFESHDINIKGDGTISCNSKVLNDPRFKLGTAKNSKHKYVELNGTKVKWASKIDANDLYPTSAMLKWRLTLPIATNRRRLIDIFGIDPDDDEGPAQPSPAALLGKRKRQAEAPLPKKKGGKGR